MSFLGIDVDSYQMVEGREHGGARVLWPQPVVTLATLIATNDDLGTIEAEQNLHVAKLLFREDQFDPVTRVRRGRLYRNAGGSQPQMWRQIHSEVQMAPRDMWLCTFQPIQWRALNPHPTKQYRRIALGTQNAYSIWEVVMVEAITGRSDLITLRSHSTFGLLPDAKELAIDDSVRERVGKAISAAVDASHKQLTDATVDACRHVAVLALGGWLKPRLANAETLDLGKLIREMDRVLGQTSPSIVRNAGDILARLHSRTKPNEQVRYGIRQNNDADAETALSLLGLMLRELRQAPTI